jgi:hypothetical protein
VLPGKAGGAASLDDLVRYSQSVEAQGAQNKAQAEAVGKSQGEAKQTLPDTLASADATLREIDALKSHPGKGLSTGPIIGAVPGGFLGKDQTDYVARLDQLKGAATQMAISANKGGGMRLTQGEVTSLQKVAARLDRRADIDSALKDFGDVVRGVRERAGVKAGVGATPAPATQTAGAGWTTLPSGVRFRQVQ